MEDGLLLLIVGALLAGGLAVSAVGDRLRVPGLLLVMGFGMVLGTDGLGLIHFDDYALAKSIGIVALAFILFEGGLAAGFREIRPVLGSAISLAVIGTALTAILAGVAAYLLLDLTLLEGLLLGSILAATDGAAIFAILRGSSLRRRVARTLEGEAGMNDPVAVLLVLGFSAWITQPDHGPVEMLTSIAVELSIGAVTGVAVGMAVVYVLRRVPLGSAGLYPVASVALATLAFGVGDVAHGSGFLSVYLAGLVLGTADLEHREMMRSFHDGLGWVAQLVMFLALGLLVFPSDLPAVVVPGTILAVLTAVVARPLAAWIATTRQGYSPAERVVLGWAGLRGAVPVVLATFPVIEGVPRSEEFFAIAFFAVLLSTLVQGVTFERLAERLGVTSSEPALPESGTPTSWPGSSSSCTTRPRSTTTSASRSTVS